jgi:hypothetical protein
MTDHPITFPLPEYLYDRARQIAEATAQPIESVLVRQLEEAFAEPLPTLLPGEQAELDALTNLSDDALWTFAQEQMPSVKQERMQILMRGNTKGTLTISERAELDLLVEQGQRLMLRKAQAAALLTERGYKVTPKDMAKVMSEI